MFLKINTEKLMQQHSTDSCRSEQGASDPVTSPTVSGDRVYVTVQAGSQGLACLVTFRRSSNSCEAQLQLISSPRELERLQTPDGYFLDAIDLLTLERNCGTSEVSRRVACVLTRDTNNLSELSHLIITATGALYATPPHASGDVFNMGD